MSSGSDLLIRNADQIVTVESGNLEVQENMSLAVAGDTVSEIGQTDSVESAFPNPDRVIDASGKAVLPGFIDPHTHALFAGDRSDEFAAKLRGKTYQDILADGGGILRTVRAVREATDKTLLENLRSHLDVMAAHGTTTVEVKTGYGLDTETELRMLEVIEQADQNHPLDVVPTFLGAHAVPEGQSREAYVEAVIEDQLPAVADQGIAEFVDVFCDEGAFTAGEARRILEAGRDYGLKVKIHAEEFSRLGGAQIAADLAGTSADHLLQATEADASALSDSGVIPVLLPGTAFSLGAEYADPEPLQQAGADVALATDFNPNCHSQSMQFAITLGCVGMGMSPEAALVGATRNGALALDRTDGRGTLQPGTPADAVILDAPSYEHVPYRFGVNTVETVIKAGSVLES
jgi:imidazolonepropionase